jgi:hypothetical protein
MLADIDYLRGCAQRCASLARDCPDIATSQALEELSIELMDKAAELDQLVGNDLGLRA